MRTVTHDPATLQLGRDGQRLVAGHRQRLGEGIRERGQDDLPAVQEHTAVDLALDTVALGAAAVIGSAVIRVAIRLGRLPTLSVR